VAEDEPNISLEHFVEVEHAKPVEHAMRDYWRGLAASAARYGILDHPMPQDAPTASAICALLKALPGITPAQQMPYRIRVEGRQAVAGELQNRIQKHLKSRRPHDGEKAFAQELNAYLVALTPGERQPFLGSLRQILPSTNAEDPFLLAINTAAARSGKKK
jgi:hypothetical protein